MTSTPERIGAALAEALRGTLKTAPTDKPRPAAAPDRPPIYHTSIRNVPKLKGLEPGTSSGDLQVQLLVDRQSTGADHTVGWIVLKPGARHERHRHGQCEDSSWWLRGRGHISTATSARNLPSTAIWLMHRVAHGIGSTLLPPTRMRF